VSERAKGAALTMLIFLILVAGSSCPQGLAFYIESWRRLTFDLADAILGGFVKTVFPPPTSARTRYE